MKRLIILLACLTSLTAPALAQATNGSVTLTPFRGSTAFVPGAAIAGTGKNWHEGTQGYADPIGLKYRYEVRAQPGNVTCYVFEVEPDRLWFFLGFLQPNTTSITISLRLPDPNSNEPDVVGGGVIRWTETVPLTTSRAVPILTGAGQWYAFTDARLHEFGVSPTDGVNRGAFILPRNGLRFDLALFASNLGGLSLWVVQVSRDGAVVLEALAFTEFANQARQQDNVQLQLNQLAVGNYSVRIYALDDPALISPAINLTIQ